MIRVYLNNQSLLIDQSLTLSEFLNHQGYVTDNYAIAVNQRFITKTQYDKVILNHHDCIDIIRPMQGG